MSIEPGERAAPAPGPGDYLAGVGLLVALVATPLVFWPGLYDDFTLLKQATLLAAAACIIAGLAWEGFPLPASRAFRVALAAWSATLIVSSIAGFDPRGGLLGVYQYRQGLLTQLSYIVLMAGGARAASAGWGRRLFAAPLAGLAGAFTYTAVQAVGADPVDWWIDTSARAIGTIGNANELAAYAVVCLSSAAAFAGRAGRRSFAGIAAVAGAVTFTVFESESRSGLAALALFAAVLPVAWAVAGAGRAHLARLAAALGAGAVAGLVLAVAAGSFGGSAGRIQAGAAGADAGGSTRVELWRGTAEVIKARPLFGAGADALGLAFPRYRPAGLGGAFRDYDLTVQSSHNLALDIAANAGLPGLLAFGSVVALALWASYRTKATLAQAGRERRAITWTTLVSYGAITMLNPVSLAAHALFAVLLGVLASGTGASAPLVPARGRLAVRAGGGVLAAGLGVVAILLPLADLRANGAWGDYEGRRFAGAAAGYRAAGRLMPLERRYAEGLAESHLAAAVEGPKSELDEADAAYERLDDRFGFAAGDALGQAAAWIMLGREGGPTLSLIDRGLELNPNGVSMEWYVGQLRAAVDAGGVLRYSDRDHWTYIEPAPDAGR